MSLAATIKIIKEGGQLAVENIPYLRQVPRELLNLGSEASKGGPGAVKRKQNIPNIKFDKKNTKETIRVANELIDIYNDRGINTDKRILAKALGYNQQSLTAPFYTPLLKPINTKDMNVLQSFKKIMGNTSETPVENIFSIRNKIAKDLGYSKGHGIDKYRQWKQSDLFKKYNREIGDFFGNRGLAQVNFQNFLLKQQEAIGKKLSVDEAFDLWLGRTKNGTASLNQGSGVAYEGPASTILTYAAQHTRKGGKSIEWLSGWDPVAGKITDVSKVQFRYLTGVDPDKIYNTHNLKLTRGSKLVEPDPNFREFHEVFDKKRAIEYTDVIDPRVPGTDKTVKWNKLMKDTYRRYTGTDQYPLNVDHTVDIKNGLYGIVTDPFKNLRLLDGPTNNMAGQISKQSSFVDKGLLKDPNLIEMFSSANRKGLYEMSGYSSKIGKDLNTQGSEFFDEGLDLVDRVFNKGEVRFDTPLGILKKQYDMMGDKISMVGANLTNPTGLAKGGIANAVLKAQIEKAVRPQYKKGGKVDSPLNNIADVVQIKADNRENFSIGGIAGDKTKSFSFDDLNKNKVGTLESMLAGIGSGLIDIPKGAFTLGAALLDLGFGTSNAAKVESFFDDLTDLDEKAESTFMGNLTKIMVNLGVPGGIAAKKGAELTTKALLAKKNGNYFKLTDPRLQEKFKTSLNAKGRLFATLGAAGAAGAADAVFVGDPEHVGTIGDMFGGPTQLLENDENSAAREVINRMKFGLDTSLLMGIVGGSGSAIKSIVRRRNELESNNDAIDKFLGAFRPRGMTSQEFFDLQRGNIGDRAGDINYASQISRSLDKHIDAIFPYAKNIFNKEGNKGRREFMAKLNDTLLSGGVDFDDATKQVRFGEMNAKKVEEITSMMRAKGGKAEDIQGVLNAFGDIRGGWGHMFTRLGGAMDDAAFTEFSSVFGNKFKDYLGATYDVFRNKSLIPLFNYKPSAEAIEKTVKVFREAAEAKGTPITKEEAEYYVSKVIDSARPARTIATKADETSGVYFNVPDFFVNNSTIADIEKIGVGRTTVPLDALTDSVKPVFDEVLGKIQDPMQTILTGTNKLSLVSRRNEFFQTLKNENATVAAARKAFQEDPENAGKVLPPELRGFFRETELEAMNELGKNVKQIKIDESRSIEAGITNPLHDLYAEKGVAEAIEEAGMLARDNGTLKQLYDNFVLYPKATSQMAKTILSPITHARNFISAGAFATANGLIPGLTVSVDDSTTAFKEAFGMLQTNIPGTRQANDRYRELLRLGVVNSGVKLGDLQKLLNDVNFGESFTGTQQLKDQMRKLSKLKKWTEDMYTAEDDFWKISSFAMERGRLKKVYDKYSMKYTDDLLDSEAAEIVRNNIPNYDMVSSFVKSLRQLPFGNFVSFPAEIYRTSFNIMGRIMKEFNTPHTLADGRTVYPFRSIAMKRALGFGTTVVGVPYATVEGMKAIHNVTEDEMQALRRFVPDWSKNSTLVPVRGDDGDLKYIDFSHANAYDAMIRPWTTMFNGLQKGIAEDDIKKELLISMIDATKETASPFVSESIWTSAIADISPILGRNGRTQSGRRLWTDETPMGDIFMESIKHLGATVIPGSLPAFNRLRQAVTEEVDEYGRTYEFLDEALGVAGLRAVQVDPVAAMKFKIADFRTGLNDARREFTGPLLKGGPVTAEQIVDQYQVANQAMHRVQKRMFDDYYAARILGAGQDALNSTFEDRVSDTQLRAIRLGRFKPFVPSENIEQAFRDNARAIGEPDAYRRARETIRRIMRRYNNSPLSNDLPLLDNPFRTSLGTRVSEPFAGITTQPLQNLGLTSPTIGNNLNQTAARGQQVFGSTDTIFGS